MNACAVNSAESSMRDCCVKGLLLDYGGTLDNNGDHWGVTIHDAWCTLPLANVDIDTYCKAYIYAERELGHTRHIAPGYSFAETMLVKARLELMHLRSLGYSLSQAEIESHAAAIAHYCDCRARSCAKHSAATLDTLAARYPLALVSNFYGNVEAVLNNYDLRRYFRQVIDSASVGIRKPNATLFVIGAKSINLTPEQTAVVGDSPSKDILPAQSIGCDTVWIKGRAWFGDKPENVPGKMITDIRELETLY